MREEKKNGLISGGGWNGEVCTFELECCVDACVKARDSSGARVQWRLTKARGHCSSSHCEGEKKK